MPTLKADYVYILRSSVQIVGSEITHNFYFLYLLAFSSKMDTNLWERTLRCSSYGYYDIVATRNDKFEIWRSLHGQNSNYLQVCIFSWPFSKKMRNGNLNF